MENFDYKAMEALALEQLKTGKPLLGKGGAFAPLLEKIPMWVLRQIWCRMATFKSP